MALTPLDFPASPTVGTLYPDPPVTGQPTYRWDGAQWLSYAAASLPTPTKPANYGKKNYIINGAMMVSQENGAAAGNVTGYYPVDQFSVNFFGMSGVINMAQMTSSPSPAGSPNRLWTIVATPDTAVGGGDLVYISYPIEGLRAADLSFGSASAKTITIQFGVKAPAGTYCVSVLNKGSTRAYVAEYVIAAGEANTSVVKSVTIPGDVTGTWVKDNTIGMNIAWCLMAGATYQTPAGAWAGGNFLGSSNQFNFMGTINNVFELFDVSLTEGTVAPPFQVPDYASELALCRRYFQQAPFNVYVTPTGASQKFGSNVTFSVPMRAVPTMGTPFISAADNGNSGVTSTGWMGLTSYSAAPFIICSTGVPAYVYGWASWANARL